MSASATFQRTFCEQLADDLHLAQLFEYLPEVYLYVKDAESRFVKVNQALLELRGLTSEAEVIGKTDFDLHPEFLAERYIAEDRRVMQSRVPLPNQVWLVPDREGELKWFVSSKIPLFDRKGNVVGLAGVMRDLAKTESILQPYRELESAITYVLDHYAERISVGELAGLTHLSISQFDRKFKRVYQMTPQQYILRVRINSASHQLINSDRSIAEIAQATGFYDQSYFAKQFRKQFDLSPLAYRKTYREAGGSGVRV